MAWKFIDAETGDEILIFVRRGKYYCYLRDRETKLFIRRLPGFGVWVAFLFEYPTGKKRNPLYVDLKVGTSLKPEEVEILDDVIDKMVDEGLKVIRSYFGVFVEALSDMVGVEYSSVLAKYWYPEAVAYLVWHHYKDDWREREEFVLL